MREFEQRFLIKPDQRGFQQGRKVQIIIGQQKPGGECQHILHCQFIRQDHAVNAANRDGKLLQFAHKCGRKPAAFACPQQHQDIAGANAPAMGLSILPALFDTRRKGFMFDHALDALRQRRCQGRCSAFRRHCLFGGRPIGRRVGLCSLQDRPKLHATGMARAIRVMAQGCIGRDTITRRCIRKYRIHQGEHGFGGAEGNIQRHWAEFQPGCFHNAFVMALCVLESLYIGALEGIDGLFLIADGEDAALFIPRTKTGEKFRRKRVHDIPLVRVGILRLIQQDMVKPIIQLKQNPSAARIIEQFARARDQIIIIEQAGIFLRRLIAAQHRRTNGEKRHAGGKHACGGAFAIQHQLAFALVPHKVIDFILPRAKLLGCQFDADRIVPSDKNGAPIGMFCNALSIGQCEPCCQFLAMANILLAAGKKKLGRRAKILGFRCINHRSFNCGLIFLTRENAKLPRQCRPQPCNALAILHGLQHFTAGTGHGVDHLGKASRCLILRQNRERILRGPARQQRIAFAREQGPAILFLHHRELRRQARFQRKAAQQRLRETMQG